MTAEMVTPAWMHQQVTAEQYAAWTEEQCAGVEIVDGMVCPGVFKLAVPFPIEIDLGRI